MPSVFPTHEPEFAIAAALDALRAGELAVIPTETVYGLAGDACNGEAVARIFQMKGRPSFNPLICHVDGIEMAKRFGHLNPLAQKLADRFWPGPLTLVVPLQKEAGISDLVTAGLDSIGLRCPEGIARQIITGLQKPLAAPSANRSGRISPTTAQHVFDEFSDEPLVIIDDGPCQVGLESTILKIDGDTLVLLRHGSVTAEEIEAVTGVHPVSADARDGIQAPGMMVSHYAPDAKVRLDCQTCDIDEAWLGFGNGTAPQACVADLNLSPSGDLIEAAANLYAHLKQLDAARPKAICVAPIPKEGLGLAINDRLSRAGAPRDQDASPASNLTEAVS